MDRVDSDGTGWNQSFSGHAKGVSTSPRFFGVSRARGDADAWTRFRPVRRLTEAQPLEPWTVAGVVLVLGAVIAAATVVPARRAARVDPMLTLRVD